MILKRQQKKHADRACRLRNTLLIYSWYVETEYHMKNCTALQVCCAYSCISIMLTEFYNSKNSLTIESSTLEWYSSIDFCKLSLIKLLDIQKAMIQQKRREGAESLNYNNRNWENQIYGLLLERSAWKLYFSETKINFSDGKDLLIIFLHNGIQNNIIEYEIDTFYR